MSFMLYRISWQIAKYKYEFKLADKLDEFVYFFERDDCLSREYWYGSFKAGLEWPREG